MALVFLSLSLERVISHIIYRLFKFRTFLPTQDKRNAHRNDMGKIFKFSAMPIRVFDVEGSPRIFHPRSRPSCSFRLFSLFLAERRLECRERGRSKIYAFQVSSPLLHFRPHTDVSQRDLPLISCEVGKGGKAIR